MKNQEEDKIKKNGIQERKMKIRKKLRTKKLGEKNVNQEKNEDK